MTSLTVLTVPAGGAGSDDMLRAACAIAGREGRIVVLGTTLVHRALPLDDLPTYFDDEVVAVLTHAVDVTSRYGMSVEARLRRTYDRARTIAREAIDVRADALFVELKKPRLPAISLQFDRTTRSIMKFAPCPLFLTYLPSSATLDSSLVIAQAERLLKPVS